MGKKQKRLAQEQADGMPLTRAQVIMRDEMTRGPVQPTLFDDEIDDETPEQHGNGFGPETQRVFDEFHTAGQVIDEMIMKDLHRKVDSPIFLRASRMPDTRELALNIITESPTLNLSLQQWQIVQDMIEKGIRVGFEHGGRAAR